MIMTIEQRSSRAPKIAIIGGGLTGLLTATLLERALSAKSSSTAIADSAQIDIFEKSRSVGRLATRYRSDALSNQQWQWAFGAQFFTAKSEAFKSFLAPYLQSSLLQPWHAQVVDLTPNDGDQQSSISNKEQWDNSHARYISTPKMTSWGRVLAEQLRFSTIHFKTRVAPLQHSQYSHESNAPTTELFDEVGNSLGHFDWVICTAPNGQAVALLADGDFAKFDAILAPQMQACYTLMLGWNNQAALPKILQQADITWDVAYMHDPILSRAFMEHRKPARDTLLPSVTIHARNDWSEAHVDEDIETIRGQLIQAAQRAFGWEQDSAPSQIDCHRWRYASTVTPQPATAQGVLIDPQQQWIVSGDWCAQGNIESCYQVAIDTVRAIITN